MQFKSKFTRAAVIAALAVGTIAPVAGSAEAATYGCFKVTAGHLNIRAKPYASSDVIGVAKRGEVLEKRKMFCTPRGFWCAVRHGSLEGYADKDNMVKVTCP